MKNRGSGVLRLPVIVATGIAPAERASALEFPELLGVRRLAEPDADEDRAFAALRPLEQGVLPALRSSGLRDRRFFFGHLRAVGRRTFRAGTTVEMACL